jgi:hypothetical protein
LWFAEYTDMVSEAYPAMQDIRRLKRLLEDIQDLNRSLRDEGLV